VARTPDDGFQNAQRAQSLRNWEEAASGWARRSEEVREFAAPLTHWLIDAINPQPGERVLELAAGLGETGLLVAELVAPAGGVIVSDQAEAMLAGARERAAALGLSNVEFSVLNAEWIDLPVASVDAVVCRWGYMLMTDPSAALHETRRVLRPGCPRPSCASAGCSSRSTRASRARSRSPMPSACASSWRARGSSRYASNPSSSYAATRASTSSGR
jgi:ubiquinone/menaquinone biosynthesis C-methylase UbiE